MNINLYYHVQCRIVHILYKRRFPGVQLQLPKGLQPAEQDEFIVELENPKTGRASLGDDRHCFVTVNNDISKYPQFATLGFQHQPAQRPFYALA